MSDSKTSTKPVKTTNGAGWLINIISFGAVVCIGIALILSEIGFLSEVASAFLVIAETIAFFVVAIVSVFYVVKKKNVWIWLTWAGSVALIVVSYII